MELDITKEFVALYFNIDESLVEIQEIEGLGLSAIISTEIVLKDNLLEDGKLPFNCGIEFLHLKSENLEKLKDLSNVFSAECIAEGLNPCDFNVYGIDSLALKGDFKDFKINSGKVGAVVIVNSNLIGDCFIDCQSLEVRISYVDNLKVDVAQAYFNGVDIKSLDIQSSLVIFENCILSNLNFKKLDVLILDTCKILKLELSENLKVLKVLNCEEIEKIEFPKYVEALQLSNLPSIKNLDGISKSRDLNLDAKLKKMKNGDN